MTPSVVSSPPSTASCTRPALRVAPAAHCPLPTALAVVQIGNAQRLVRRSFVYGALVIAQLAVSRGDESRNLSHLAPIILPLAALELEHLRGSGDFRLAVATAACLASMVNFRWTCRRPRCAMPSWRQARSER